MGVPTASVAIAIVVNAGAVVIVFIFTAGVVAIGIVSGGAVNDMVSGCLPAVALTAVAAAAAWWSTRSVVL